MDCLSIEKSHETGMRNVVDKIISGNIGIMNGRGGLWPWGVSKRGN